MPKKNVVILVHRGPNNEPALDHDSHVVQAGGKVAWIATDDQQFVIEFETDSPSQCGSKTFPSKDSNGLQMARLSTKRLEKTGIFKYSVTNGAAKLDPYIIVDPT